MQSPAPRAITFSPRIARVATFSPARAVRSVRRAVRGSRDV